MSSLPFSMELMEYLLQHRSAPLTAFLQVASFMGEVEGYVLIVMALYVAYDKSLATRLGLVALGAMLLNHVLKIIIKNPRPFVAEGTYLENWAIASDRARELVLEYSTPSGHAMAGMAFYVYLFATVKNPFVRGGAVVAILLTGLSRPYLGVHYLEDIIVGWGLGLCVALVSLGYGDSLGRWWIAMRPGRQAALCVAASLVLLLVTIELNGGQIDDQPRAFLAYAGLVTGILVARPLELRHLNFDPISASWRVRIVRYVLGVVLVLATLKALEQAFAAAANLSLLGYVVQYVRYVVAGIVSIYVAPWLFTKLQLAPHRATD